MAQALVQEAPSFDVAKPERSRAATETITLAIDGMHCGACIRPVEAALGQVPGVVSARVNLSNRRAAVEVQHGRVSAEVLIEALDAAGHKAAELATDSRIQAFDSDKDLLRRLGVAGFAAMNIMLLSVSVWSGAGADMDTSVQTLFHWLSALIALPAVAYSGQPFFRSAVQALKGRRLNMDVPISLGVLLATFMSLYQTTRASEQVYFDAAVTLLAFLLLGRLLDQQMRTRASSAATNLLGLKASSASVLDESGAVSRVAVKTIDPGTRVVAAAGERLAVDGVVASGTTDIDQSLITGESLPKRAAPGDTVFAGTMNLGNPIVIVATKREDSSLLADIARLMLAAEQGRGKYVRLADRAARLYAPAVHILGLTTFAGWMYAGHSWQEALTAAIAVLIVTCPCALALAVPAVQVAAASRLFSKGIILKAADGLERLAEVDTVVFDKTGTLTLGEPRLLNAASVPKESLAAVAGLAAVSRHPYSRAIVAAARDQGLTVRADDNVNETAGFGLSRTLACGEERLGSASWCGKPETEPGATGTIWFKPTCGPAIAFRFADALREDGAPVIKALTDAGYGVEILSGDSATPVELVAGAAGVTTWHAAQRPDQKIAKLDLLKAKGHKVLMVGDGLNDAPALASAHASLSPASACDISQTAADAIFQGARLQPIVELLAVAKAARALSLQNFGLAVAYNVVFVPLAMAGLVTPLIAALAMSASSISVTANAIRLKSKTLELKA
jgi:P-type Cu2+ transporter